MPRLPSYTRSLFLFHVFNASNFTLALGAPMVLLARFLGASESAIGILIALTPFLATLQMFSTDLAERRGYRALMLMGWGTRALMLLLVIPLPLLVGHVPSPFLVAALFVSLFAFNAVRGVAACAWFPWIRLLVPAELRGYYLGLEQRIIHASIFVSMLLCGWLLGHSPSAWRYSAIFTLSWLTGMASLVFLRQVPDLRPHSPSKASRRSLRERFDIARQIWSHKAFRQVTHYGALSTFAQAAVPGFLVLYLRDELAWSERAVLLFNAGSTVTIFAIAVLWGRLNDRVGSRPLVRLASWGQILMLVFWVLFASGLVEARMATVGTVYILWGTFMAASAVAQVRLVLAFCPESETTVAVMVYQVLASLCGGFAPILWGFGLDALRRVWGYSALGISVPYTIFFLITLLLFLVSQVLLTYVREPRALPTRRLLVQVLWGWPLRLLSGFAAEDR